MDEEVDGDRHELHARLSAELSEAEQEGGCVVVHVEEQEGLTTEGEEEGIGQLDELKDVIHLTTQTTGTQSVQVKAEERVQGEVSGGYIVDPVVPSMPVVGRGVTEHLPYAVVVHQAGDVVDEGNEEEERAECEECVVDEEDEAKVEGLSPPRDDALTEEDEEEVGGDDDEGSGPSGEGGLSYDEMEVGDGGRVEKGEEGGGGEVGEGGKAGEGMRVMMRGHLMDVTREEGGKRRHGGGEEREEGGWK